VKPSGAPNIRQNKKPGDSSRNRHPDKKPVIITTPTAASARLTVFLLIALTICAPFLHLRASKKYLIAGLVELYRGFAQISTFSMQ
jgi:hypothetical protein